MIQPIGFRGCRKATSTPTAANGMKISTDTDPTVN